MWSKVEWFTPAGTMAPVGPYSHIAKVGQFITIGATAGVDPENGDVVGPSVASQTRCIGPPPDAHDDRAFNRPYETS